MAKERSKKAHDVASNQIMVQLITIINTYYYSNYYNNQLYRFQLGKCIIVRGGGEVFI